MSNVPSWFEESESGVGEAVADLEAVAPDRAKRAPRPRKGFSAHLERVEQIIEPEGYEGLDRLLIGEDVSERLDVTPARFGVIVTRRPKYAYRNRDGVFQAPAPAHIVESGVPTERLLAQIAVSKYADGLPLCRQEAIYARDKVELSRSLMAQWMGKVGFELQPLADYVLERIKQGERVFAGETTLPILAPGTGKFGKLGQRQPAHGRLSLRGRSGRRLRCAPHGGLHRHPAGRWILGLHALAKAKARSNEAGALAGCWAHLRRRFYELHISGSSQIATQSVTTMAELWYIEEEVRGQVPATRAAVRQDRSVAIVADLFKLWEKELPRISGKSKLAEAIRLRHVQAGCPRALPGRRPRRDRLQYR
ncbi:conserved hypothetical protein [Mesorhizobium sp. STM 4661]|nr:conserved hypothetical protein [Mesorhizobium sp. STM 4661]